MPAALPLQSLISQASTGATEFRIIEMKYGNGYGQRAADGLNNSVSSWEVSWENILASEQTTIITAFETARGVDYFTWTPPGSASEKKFIVKKYSQAAMSGEIYSVSASLEQTFDLT